MGHVKRFGDFCAAFAAFAAAMFMFRQFMGFDFGEVEGIIEKLKYFFSNEPRREYRYYLTLFLFFALSFAVSTAFHKLPFLTLAVTVLPMLQTVIMLDGNYIYERPMVFVVLSVLHSIGCLYECIRRDGEDKGHRAALALDLFGLSIAAFCGYILYASKGIADVEFEHISVIEKTLYSAVVYFEADLTWFKCMAIIFCALALVRLLLRDLYYVDAFLSLIPAAACTYFWFSDKIPVFGSALFALTVAYAMGRIAVMLFCKPRLRGRDTNKETGDGENEAEETENESSKNEGLENQSIFR